MAVTRTFVVVPTEAWSMSLATPEITPVAGSMTSHFGGITPVAHDHVGAPTALRRLGGAAEKSKP